jgi:hypothetical protein
VAPIAKHEGDLGGERRVILDQENPLRGPIRGQISHPRENARLFWKKDAENP